MANLPLLTLAAAAAQGYGNQQDANATTESADKQQQFDNSIKTRTLDQSAAEAAANHQLEQSRLDQAANSQRANLIMSEQAQIEARLHGMAPNDPGAAPLIQRHIQNDSELRSLLPGSYSGGVGNSQPQTTPTPNVPPQQSFMTTGTAAPTPAAGNPPAAIPPTQNGGPSLDQAADMYTMTPDEEAAAKNAADLAAADLKAKQDTNAATEQKTAEGNSLDAFIAAGTKYKDPTQNLQAQVAFNQQHGTNYPVTGSVNSVYPNESQLPAGTQGPQPLSYTQPPYQPSMADQNSLDLAAANLKEAQIKGRYAEPIAKADIGLKGAQTKDAIANATKSFAEAKQVPLDDWVKRYTDLAAAGSKEDPALKQQQSRLADLTKAIQQAETNRTAAANGGQDTKSIDAYIANLQQTEYNVGLDVAARLSQSPSGTLQPPNGIQSMGVAGPTPGMKTVPTLPGLSGPKTQAPPGQDAAFAAAEKSLRKRGLLKK